MTMRVQMERFTKEEKSLPPCANCGHSFMFHRDFYGNPKKSIKCWYLSGYSHLGHPPGRETGEERCGCKHYRRPKK